MASDGLESVFKALNLEVSGSQREALNRYVALLLRWNKAYNLTAVRNQQGILSHHLADCLSIVPALARGAVQGRILDVGSGGGLPGVIVAVLLPQLDVTCVDAVGKKAAFVRQVSGELALPNLHAVHARVEAMTDRSFDLVISRAFASLAHFTQLTAHLLKRKGSWLAMKGKRPDGEIAELPPDIEMFHVEQLDVPGLNAERCLVWMQHRLVNAPGDCGGGCVLS